MSLFEASSSQAPLAERMRPLNLEEYLGQEDHLKDGALLRGLLERSSHSTPPAILLWGPPGCGKTSLAKILAESAKMKFVPFSAVSSGVKELREIIDTALEQGRFSRQRTLLFIDEIHRFSKSQQDALLPAVEQGAVWLLGATTENPSFEINSALLSRSRVIVLKPLSDEAMSALIDRALQDSERGLADAFSLESEAKQFLIQVSMGDARSALNTLELATFLGSKRITRTHIESALQKRVLRHDKNGEEHFNLASALQKSIRHSDPQAALYYLVRLIEAGEDPLFIARRLVRTASEDIGLAEPEALQQALAAKDAVEFLGYPECDTALAQACIYLALSPKSNEIYNALKRARENISRLGPLVVPLHMRNAASSLLKDLGYAQGYQYDHDAESGVGKYEALPLEIQDEEFYRPKDQAFERELKKRLEYFKKLRKPIS